MKSNERYRILLISIVISIGLIPVSEALISSDVDGSLAVFMNYAFAEKRSLINFMVFPHGPLSWLLYPIDFDNHIILAYLFRLFVNIIFCISALSLFISEKRLPLLSKLLGLIFLASILDTQLLLIGTQVFLCIHFLRYQANSKLYLSALVLTLSLFLKAYSFVIICSIFLSLAVYCFFRYRNKRTALLYSFGIFLSSFLLIRILIFRTVKGSLDHVVGFIGLSSNNTDAAALYVNNNWVLLSGSILLLIFIALYQLNKKKGLFFLVFTLSLLLQWKYSMSRQDILHNRMLFLYLLVLYYAYILYCSEIKLKIHIALVIAIGFFFLNHIQIFKASGVKLRATNFSLLGKYIFSKTYQDSLRIANTKMTNEFRLNQETRDIISDHSVELYPGQYLYMYQQNLNWVSRPVVQSYASYTSSLDKQNLSYFKSDSSPEFIIWHLSDPKQVPWHEERFGSIDYRSVLNDEPQTIQYLLSNYKIILQEVSYLLLKRTNEKLKDEEILDYSTAELDEWVNVDEAFPIIKIEMNKTFLGNLKSLFYKSDALFVSVETKSGHYYMNRLVEKNIKDGIVLSPLRMEHRNCFDEAIRFRISSNASVSYANNFRYAALNSEINQNNQNVLYWSNCRTKVSTLMNASVDGKSLNSEYLNLFHFTSDSIPLYIDIHLECIPQNANKLFIACAVESEGEKLLNIHKNIGSKFISPGMIHHISEHFEINLDSVPLNSALKIFIWNPHKIPFKLLSNKIYFSDRNESNLDN